MEPSNRSIDTDDRLIRNFWDISHTMRRISEGKGSQKRILMVLRERPGITQRELTAYLGIQPGSASEVLGKLETAGLLLRTPDPTDRRTTELRLTGAGAAAAQQAHERREQRHREMFACLTQEEKQTLAQLLEKVNGDWAQRYGGGDAPEERREHPCGSI